MPLTINQMMEETEKKAFHHKQAIEDNKVKLAHSVKMETAYGTNRLERDVWALKSQALRDDIERRVRIVAGLRIEWSRLNEAWSALLEKREV